MNLTEIGLTISMVSVSIAILKLHQSNGHNSGVSHEELEEKFVEAKVCKIIHKNTDEKLACIPDIKKTVTQIETKIDILLEKKS